MVAHLGSRGFIPWTPEALFWVPLTIEGGRVKDASGGPAGGQHFEKVAKLVLLNHFDFTEESKANVI